MGLSPEGRAALALAHQEKDAREGLCDYPAPEDGDDDPDPPAAPTCEYCGATAGLESRIYIGELVWCCANGCEDGPEREPGGNPELEPDPEPRRIVGHVGAVRVETIQGVPPGTPQRKRPVSYLHPVYGWYSQYAGAQACYYPGASRRPRREAEIAAHRDGVRQLGRYELLQAERRGLRDALLREAAGLYPDPPYYQPDEEEPAEETLPQDLPGWEPVVAYPAGDYRIGDAEDLLGGATTLRALTLYPSEISEGGTEVLLSHLDPLPTPPRPWWWTALCVLREQGDIPQQIAYLESVIRTEARRLVPTAPPDDPDPYPTLRPLSGQESVELYRAAAHVGRLPEVLAAADRPARLRELYSVLCGGAS